MTNGLRIALAAAFAAALSGAPAATQEAAHPALDTDMNAVIATVDGEPLTVSRFLGFFGDFIRSERYHAAPPERMRALAEQAVEKFVVKELLAREAERRAVPPDEAEVETRLAKIGHRYHDSPNWPAIEAALPRIRASIETESRIDALRAQVIEMDDPDESTLRRFYEAHREELFTRPEAMNLDMILVGVAPSAPAEKWAEADQKAEALRRRILAGEDFGKLALENSFHRTAARGGALGDVHAGQMPFEVEDKLRALTPGEISAPTRMLEGVAIFRLNGRTPPTVSPFDDVRARARLLYKQQQQDERWGAFLAELRPHAVIDRAVFDRLMEDAAAAPAEGR